MTCTMHSGRPLYKNLCIVLPWTGSLVRRRQTSLASCGHTTLRPNSRMRRPRSCCLEEEGGGGGSDGIPVVQLHGHGMAWHSTCVISLPSILLPDTCIMAAVRSCLCLVVQIYLTRGDPNSADLGKPLHSNLVRAAGCRIPEDAITSPRRKKRTREIERQEYRPTFVTSPRGMGERGPRGGHGGRGHLYLPVNASDSTASSRGCN